MDDIITIEECITRLDAIRHEIVPDSRDHFALSAGIAALYEMENGHAVNQWIPCSERLPEDTTCVLVTDGENIAITYFKDGEWEYHDQYGNHYELYCGITHWMPLPVSPLYDGYDRARDDDYKEF